MNREACGERKVDHENGSGTCSIASHAESVLKSDTIESRSHFNLQRPNFAFMGVTLFS